MKGPTQAQERLEWGSHVFGGGEFENLYCSLSLRRKSGSFVAKEGTRFAYPELPRFLVTDDGDVVGLEAMQMYFVVAFVQRRERVTFGLRILGNRERYFTRCDLSRFEA